MAGVPSTIFGATLRRHFLEAYAGGTWTDDTTTQDAVQATAGQRATSALVAGRRFLTFDGVNDACGGGLADVSSGMLTVGFRMRSSSVLGAGVCYLVSHGYSGFAWGVGAAGAGAGRIGITANAGTFAHANSDLADGAWHNVICSIGTTFGARCYVDGVLQTVDQPTVTAVTAGGGVDLVAVGGLLFGDGTSTTSNYPGEIGNVFIAEYEISVAEMSQLNAYLNDWASPVLPSLSRPPGPPIRAAGPPRARSVGPATLVAASAVPTLPSLTQRAPPIPRQHRVQAPRAIGPATLVTPLVSPATSAVLTQWQPPPRQRPPSFWLQSRVPPVVAAAVVPSLPALSAYRAPTPRMGPPPQPLPAWSPITPDPIPFLPELTQYQIPLRAVFLPIQQALGEPPTLVEAPPLTQFVPTLPPRPSRAVLPSPLALPPVQPLPPLLAMAVARFVAGPRVAPRPMTPQLPERFDSALWSHMARSPRRLVQVRAWGPNAPAYFVLVPVVPVLGPTLRGRVVAPIAVAGGVVRPTALRGRVDAPLALSGGVVRVVALRGRVTSVSPSIGGIPR